MPSHAILGASSAHRWMKCPGSIKLGEHVIHRPASSWAADLGTAAHELAERCLHDYSDPFAYVTQTMSNGIEVDMDTASAVSVFVDYVIDRQAADTRVWLEHTVTLDALDPPERMYGTADVILWHPAERVLELIDYKNGTGHVVEVKNNEQLKYYALAAMLTLELEPAKIITTIVQPRAAHPDGPIRTAEYTRLEIELFASELLNAAHATTLDDAPLVAGDHCRFCPAKAICPEQRKQAVALAQVEFEAMPNAMPPAPELLTNEEIALVLEKAPLVEAWFGAIRKHFEQRALAGEDVPGFKLVEKRANRKWAVDDQTVIDALHELGVTAPTTEVKRRSPAQLDKAFRAGGLKGGVPDALVERKASGYDVVLDSDSRPQVGGSAELLALPEATTPDSEPGD